MSATTNKKTAQGMHPQEGNKAKRPDAVPHGGPKVPQKAAPGTTKRIFGYIFQYKWHVVAIVLCILIGAAAQAGTALFLQSFLWWSVFCSAPLRPLLRRCSCNP